MPAPQDDLVEVVGPVYVEPGMRPAPFQAHEGACRCAPPREAAESSAFPGGKRAPTGRGRPEERPIRRGAALISALDLTSQTAAANDDPLVGRSVELCVAAAREPALTDPSQERLFSKRDDLLIDRSGAEP